MITLSSGLSFIDLFFLDTPQIIATGVLHGPGGVALVDPGPSSTLPALRKALSASGIGIEDVRALMLTHIHLDHAGSTGTLVGENPSLEVYVHEKGAPHMADPGKLVASATRLWGDDMDRLWGEVRPVPPASLRTLAGGERIAAGGRAFEVLYTPGHASHHVSYFDAASGVAFVGDTAGIRIRDGGFVLPATPPPDIDLEAWRRSLAAVGAWGADTLFVTHFGPHAPAAPHLSEMADHLDLVGDLARRSLERAESDGQRETWWSSQVRALLQRRQGGRAARDYETAGRFDLNWRGLARYWRKREPQSAGDPPSS